MAVTYISVGPALRAWMDSGLTHILLESTAAEFEAAAIAGQRHRAVAAPSPLAAQKPAPVAEPASSATGVRGRGIGFSPPPVKREGFSQAKTTGVPAAAAPGGAVPAFVSSGDFPFPPSEWPEPWRGWFAQTSSAPVLWTYHELGADLTGIGRSRERSDFFRNLLAELGLPKGSSVFWPSAMPVSAEDPSPVPHAPLFIAGLRLLMPRVVVVFGDAALEDMGFHGVVGQFGQVMVEGKLLVRLPGIEELLRGDAQRSSAVSLLRALFVGINLGK